jgi:hypothetical protein
MITSKTLIVAFITDSDSRSYEPLKDIKDLKTIKKKTTIKRRVGVEINN